ncbi:hypothetical protein B0H14DRAFT_2586283 [Mycena olivaceomarginata]|nr:hypothetical protein B0H14DRAFT_2586283 [Mycena olivaceomarginata]
MREEIKPKTLPTDPNKQCNRPTARNTGQHRVPAAQVVAVTLDALEIEVLPLTKLALSASGTVSAFTGASSDKPASFGMQNSWLVCLKCSFHPTAPRFRWPWCFHHHCAAGSRWRRCRSSARRGGCRALRLYGALGLCGVLHNGPTNGLARTLREKSDQPVVPHANPSPLADQVHRESVPSAFALTWHVAHRGEAPKSGVAFRVADVGDHFLSSHAGGSQHCGHGHAIFYLRTRLEAGLRLRVQALSPRLVLPKSPLDLPPPPNRSLMTDEFLAAWTDYCPDSGTWRTILAIRHRQLPWLQTAGGMPAAGGERGGVLARGQLPGALAQGAGGLFPLLPFVHEHLGMSVDADVVTPVTRVTVLDTCLIQPNHPQVALPNSMPHWRVIMLGSSANPDNMILCKTDETVTISEQAEFTARHASPGMLRVALAKLSQPKISNCVSIWGYFFETRSFANSRVSATLADTLAHGRFVAHLVTRWPTGCDIPATEKKYPKVLVELGWRAGWFWAPRHSGAVRPDNDLSLADSEC